MDNLTLTKQGRPLPLGATVVNGGVNFSIFSRHATSVELIIFSNSSDMEPSEIYTLDPIKNRTGDIWHIIIPNKSQGTMYLYRIDGQWNPKEGYLFNKNNLIIDPYSKALTDDIKWDLSGRGIMPKSIVICDNDFDWEDDQPLKIPMNKSVIYETHVAGLTKSPLGNFKYPGTYRGVIELIPYLKELNITAIELLPVFEFDTYEGHRKSPTTGNILENYWGYSTCAFFAPKGLYS